MRDFWEVEDEKYVFRFRNAKALLGDYHELENQEIYFCPYAELNDPAEGNMNVYWQGDRIVWVNLFKHYFKCLFLSWTLICLGDERYKEIPIWGTWREFNLDSMITELFDSDEMKFVLHMIGDYEDRVSENELQVYLFLINSRAFEIIINHLGMNADIGKNKRSFPKYDDMDGMHTYSEADRKQIFEVMNEAIYAQKEALLQGVQRDEKTRFMLIDYPQCYIKSIWELMFPKWYVSSFCRTYDNSRMWSSYADDHKGACLIFKVRAGTGGDAIRLYTCHGYSSVSGHKYDFYNEPLREINYSNSYEAINFFEMLGNVPGGMLRELFTDDEGRVSSYWVYDDSDEWRNRYWGHMDDTVCTKTEDWKEERECRVVLESGMVMSYDNTDERRVKYDFKELAGIILGMRIAEEDKREIVSILHQKCEENNVLEFPSYQEKIDKETGRIKIMRLAVIGGEK